MALEIQGKLVEIYATQQVTDKFKKREFVIETIERYPQFVKIQLNQDKCGLLDDCKVGEEIKVSFNLNGRPYTKKTGEQDYITNIVGWKIDKQGSNSAPEAPVFNIDTIEDDGSDLPF